MENSLKLPTDGGTGSIVSDFNNDGFQDIFFFCHRADGSYDDIGKFGDHHANSLIYWGSGKGFNKSNCLKIPSVGVHYDVGIDIGHISDRSFVFEYFSSPYKTDQSQPVSHPGEEFFYILEGQVEIRHGMETYILNAGDSVYWDSNEPHQLRALGTQVAHGIAVLYPRN